MLIDQMVFPRPRRLPALVLAGMLIAAGPASARTDESPHRPPDPGAVLDDLSELLDQLGRMVDRMPRYALPEVTADGDIIIRRKDDPDDPDHEGGDDEGGGDDSPSVDRDGVIDL